MEIFNGTPNGKYLEHYQLYKDIKSLVLKRIGENQYQIIETFNSPIAAINKQRSLIEQDEANSNNYLVHFNL